MIFSRGFDFYGNNIDIKIREEQKKEEESTLNKLMTKHVSIGDGSRICSFKELRRSLARQCNASNIVHATNDFSDNLHVTINGTEFSLTMSLFPRGNAKKQIEISINQRKIIKRISAKSIPDSIVNYLVAISEWIPEYTAIEERIRTEEEKKRIACKIAYDALEKIVDETLKGKGYTYNLKNQGHYNSAVLRIKSGKSIYMKIEIKLLEDFIERISAILESLPIFTPESTNGENDPENNPDDFFGIDDFDGIGYGLGEFGYGFRMI